MSNLTASRSKLKSRAILILAAAGILANYLRVPLDFGYELTWGSIFVLLTVWLYGTGWGTLIALVSCCCGVVLYGHPESIILAVGEALLVGLALKRKSTNVLVLDAIYWLCIGMPIIWLLYRYCLGYDTGRTVLAALKYAVNGIFNALVTSMLISYLLSRRARDRRAFVRPTGRIDRRQTNSLANTLFNLLVSCVLVPTLVLTIANGRAAFVGIQNDIDDHLAVAERSVAGNLDAWRENHVKALQALAQSPELDTPASAIAAQSEVIAVFNSLPDIEQLSVVDAHGAVLAQYPPAPDALLTAERPTPSISHIELPGPISSDPQILDGGINHSEVGSATITVPVTSNGKISGAVIGTINLAYVGRIVGWNAEDRSLDIAVVNSQRRVVADVDPDKRWSRGDTFDLDALPPGSGEQATFHWLSGSGYSLFNQHWQGLHTVRQINLPGLPWKLFLMAPYAAHQEYLQQVYTLNLGVMLALTIAALLMAAALSRALSKPLRQLALASSDLPGELLHPRNGPEHSWPRSLVIEIDSLVRNFMQMDGALRSQFNEIQSARTALATESIRLSEANRLKDDFLAVLSHELRTPLVPILGYADMLAGNSLKSEQQKEAALAIERNARTQLRLIEDLLDVSSMMSGKLNLCLGLVDMPLAVHDGLQVILREVQTKEITVTKKIDESMPRVSGDEVRIRQVVWNLLSNAVKFTPQGGNIVIDLQCNEQQVELKVFNSGAGIAPDFVPYVFDRFRQGESHLTRKAPGLGLGLFIARQIVELHHGTIAAESLGSGQGATFTVTLPLVAPPASDSG